MTDDPNVALVDAELRRLKGPLAECRAQHGVTADVTYVLNYDENGFIDNVLVDLPRDLPPAFIAQAAILIKRNVRFPPSYVAGTMTFLDLGPQSFANAAEINRAADIAEHTRKEAMKTPMCIQVVIVVAGVIAYIWLQLL